MQPDALTVLFDHHRWATLTLIDHCAALPPEQLTASVPGTMGGILDTLRHLVSADSRYLARLQGTWRRQTDTPPDERSLDELRIAFSQQHATWDELLPRLHAIDITVPAEPQTGWPHAPHATSLVVAQAIHHGNDHRTHICTILGATGQEVPDLDVWSYWEQNRVPSDASS